MPCFVCENCGAIENSATGWYWSRNRLKFKDASFNGKALCSECVPLEFDDGSPTGYNGRWHDKFPKEYFDPKVDDGYGLMNVKNGKVITKGD